MTRDLTITVTGHIRWWGYVGLWLVRAGMWLAERSVVARRAK